MERDELRTARAYVEQAVKEDPKWSLGRLSEAVILWRLGETSEALEKLAQARRKDWRITQVKDLQYEHFWRERAITAVEAMLAGCRSSQFSQTSEVFEHDSATKCL